MRVGVKRSREAASEHEPSAMEVDDDAALLRDDPGADADREDADGDDDDCRVGPPRRKRAMMIKANLQFLQKLPPLANYQRGPFGRRGGVDGGTPDGDLGMLALEETLSDSSFSVASAAAVAPVSTSGAVGGLQLRRHPTAQLRLHHQHSRQHRQWQNPTQTQTQQDGRCPQVHSSRRNASPAFASRSFPASQVQAPPLQFYHHSGPEATVSAKKDDEPRPATSGTRLW